jgi:hypothetical protein
VRSRCRGWVGIGIGMGGGLGLGLEGGFEWCSNAESGKVMRVLGTEAVRVTRVARGLRDVKCTSMDGSCLRWHSSLALDF